MKQTAFRRWKYDAVQLIRDFTAERLKKFFIADDLILHAWRVKFPEPDDNRWWGQALQEARDLGIIRAGAIPGYCAKRRHKTTLWWIGGAHHA